MSADGGGRPATAGRGAAWAYEWGWGCIGSGVLGGAGRIGAMLGVRL